MQKTSFSEQEELLRLHKNTTSEKILTCACDSQEKESFEGKKDLERKKTRLKDQQVTVFMSWR